MDSICLCSNKWCSCINITRTAFLATLEVATYFLPQCCGNKICWALGVISGKRRQRGGGSMTAAKWCWHHHRSSMMAAAWRWRQHDSGAIMSVLDIEVHQVRVKKELPSTVTCNYKSILWLQVGEAHHPWARNAVICWVLRCEDADMVLNEYHRRGDL